MDSKMKLSWERPHGGHFWLTWEGFGGRFRLMFAVLVALEGVLERLGLVLGRLGPSWIMTGAPARVYESSKTKKTLEKDRFDDLKYLLIKR